MADAAEFFIRQGHVDFFCQMGVFVLHDFAAGFQQQEYLDWYFKTLDYAKAHFADPEFGEWYGYLRREGLPTQPATKGSTFKGPFHLPRMLIYTDVMLGQLLAE